MPTLFDAPDPTGARQVRDEVESHDVVVQSLLPTLAVADEYELAKFTPRSVIVAEAAVGALKGDWLITGES
jgi:hypothetical protein